DLTRHVDHDPSGVRVNAGPQRPGRPNGKAGFLQGLTDGGVLPGLAWLDLPCRKLPKEPVLLRSLPREPALLDPAPHHQHAPVGHDDRGRDSRTVGLPHLTPPTASGMTPEASA